MAFLWVVFIYQTTQGHTPEDQNPNIHSCENMISHIVMFYGLYLCTRLRGVTSQMAV
jgi:hypothetical protein